MKFVGTQSRESIFNLFESHVSSGKGKFFSAIEMDFIFGRREGPYVWDAVSGRRLINCHCNGGVFNLGHRNPEIIETAVESMRELDIGNHHLVSEQRAHLARRLAELTPGDIAYTVFGVSGGEAVDLAIKVARAYTKKYRIVSALGGYHGHTGFALAAGDKKYRDPFGPMSPGFVQVPFGDSGALEGAIDGDTAAVIFETIPATLGMPVPASDFYREVREICDRRKVLLIIDEVQTGFGRTGKLWGIDNYGVVPDIMVLGKGMSGGIYPMSATCFREKYESVFRSDPFIHISTFGGAEVGCPVAARVLEISSDPSFLANVREMAGLFHEGFISLRERHPEILVGLRQVGLMMGIEMVSEMCGPLMTRACYRQGILSIYANNDTRVSQLLPPLIIDRAVAEEILGGIDSALLEVKAVMGL
ncbi:MAG: aspartate aminotransferase family protein [Desulfocucumaceae bacterium]